MFNVLSLETLQHKAPSIFSLSRAGHTSDKYQYISTIKLVEGLINEGFLPTHAAQSNSRLPGKKFYTKHIVRFRHKDAKITNSGLYPEIVLINSHDGLSSYRLLSGVYRIVCTNGLIAGNSYDEVRIRHQGNVMRDVIEGTYSVIDSSQKMLSAAEKMTGIKLTTDEKQYFAEAAHTLRFDGSEVGQAVRPEKLLLPHRREDAESNDLFTVFNVVQENLIKGGVRGYTRNGRGQLKRTTTRKVKSIDQNTALNRALWTLAERMMELKGN